MGISSWILSIATIYEVAGELGLQSGWLDVVKAEKQNHDWMTV